MHDTREGWLGEIVDELRPTFQVRSGRILPEVRVSLGFPSGRISKSLKGECWHTEAVSDGVHEILISPTIGDDPEEVVFTLCHELCHVLAGVKNGHNAEFKRVCKAVGLEGKPTEAMPGLSLRYTCRRAMETAGPFPGGAITAPSRKKQTTRMIKIGCECGLIARASRTTIEQMSWLCPTCQTEISEKG